MKHTREIFVYLHKWEKDEFYLAEGDMSEYGYVLIGKQQVEFEVPDNFDPVPVKIAMLKAQEAKALEEFTARINQIKEEIGKLQALTYEVPA